MNSINIYGDALISTSGSHGSDIALQRLDELDRRCLVAAAQNACNGATAVDVGCGAGSFGLRLAALGYKVHLFDLIEQSPLINAAQTMSPIFDVHYHVGDIRAVTDFDIGSVSLFYSQRTIHYLRFDEAQSVMGRFRKKMTDGAFGFISASGLRSELGNMYPDSQIESRFEHLAEAMRLKHQIFEKVCLYTKNDLSRLCELSGFSVVDAWESNFGNVKAVFKVPSI